MSNTFNYIIFLWLFSIISVIILIPSIKEKKVKFTKIYITISIIVFMLCTTYYNNYDIYLSVRSTISPNIAFEEIRDTSCFKIKIPPNSVKMYVIKDTFYYYSKSTVKECIDYFNNEFLQLKNNSEIKNYDYSKTDDNGTTTFKVYLFNGEPIEVSIFSNTGKMKFCIGYP